MSGSRPRAIRLRSVSPSTSSMAMKTRPSASPISYTAAMFGWVMAAADRASRRKRRRRPGSLSKALGKTFSATLRWSFSSVAR